MAKLRLVHRCADCGASFPKWSGQCSACGAWNTLVEDVEGPDPVLADPRVHGTPAVAQPIADVPASASRPAPTGMAELDRVLGDGIVPGSVTLVGGEPGIGKSTLLLQLLASWVKRTLYVSAEESASQVRLRAERLGALHPELWLLSETMLPHIIASIDQVQPSLVVIDSIQTVADPEFASAPGSIVQVRGCASRLVHEAKARGVPIVLVGHVTKEGGLAGPRTLEHVVDVVLSFEGDRHHSLRLLRAVKNRFGTTLEIGIFEMTGKGLKEVPTLVEGGSSWEMEGGGAMIWKGREAEVWPSVLRTEMDAMPGMSSSEAGVTCAMRTPCAGEEVGSVMPFQRTVAPVWKF